MTATNEAQLIAGAIKDVQKNGWGQSYLFNEGTQRHCILGSIGFARWGDQWNIDCTKALNNKDGNDEEMYVRLVSDPLTKSVIERLYHAILAQDPGYGEGWTPETDSFKDQYLGCAVYGWNDERNYAEGEEDVLEILQKVQAEIGVTE